MRSTLLEMQEYADMVGELQTKNESLFRDSMLSQKSL